MNEATDVLKEQESNLALKCTQMYWILLFARLLSMWSITGSFEGYVVIAKLYTFH